MYVPTGLKTVDGKDIMGFNGASPEAINSILDAMQIGMEMAKKKNKEKINIF